VSSTPNLLLALYVVGVRCKPDVFPNSPGSVPSPILFLRVQVLIGGLNAPLYYISSHPVNALERCTIVGELLISCGRKFAMWLKKAELFEGQSGKVE
jgi:hypothetical protein